MSWSTTPIGPELLRGAVELESTARGLLPHRLPAWARAQTSDGQLAMAESQPSGVRLALVQVWATATIAALVAGPGLGRIITEGFARNDYAQGMAGAVVVAVVALALELGAAAVQRAADPMRSRSSPDRDDAVSVPSTTVEEAPTGG